MSDLNPEFKKYTKKFIERCRNGEVPNVERGLDEAIHAWHEGDGPGLSLHMYLGLSWEEYAKWCEGKVTIGQLVADSPPILG